MSVCILNESGPQEFSVYLLHAMSSSNASTSMKLALEVNAASQVVVPRIVQHYRLRGSVRVVARKYSGFRVTIRASLRLL